MQARSIYLKSKTKQNRNPQRTSPKKALNKALSARVMSVTPLFVHVFLSRVSGGPLCQTQCGTGVTAVRKWGLCSSTHCLSGKTGLLGAPGNKVTTVCDKRFKQKGRCGYQDKINRGRRAVGRQPKFCAGERESCRKYLEVGLSTTVYDPQKITLPFMVARRHSVILHLSLGWIPAFS